MDSRYIYFNNRERFKLLLTMSESTISHLQYFFKYLSEQQYIEHQIFSFPGDKYMLYAS